jgi:hypothetical protein
MSTGQEGRTRARGRDGGRRGADQLSLISDASAPGAQPDAEDG